MKIGENSRRGLKIGEFSREGRSGISAPTHGNLACTMPRTTRAATAKPAAKPAKATSTSAAKGKAKATSIDSSLHSESWLKVPENATLKVDLACPLQLPSSDDIGFIMGKGMLLARGSYVSHVRHQYEYLKDSDAVPIAAGHGLKLIGDVPEAFCEGLLDNDNGSDSQKGRYVLAMPLPLRKGGRGAYKTEEERLYVEVSQIEAVTASPLTLVSGMTSQPCALDS